MAHDQTDTAPRLDLQAYLDDRRSVIVLCSDFDDAPHAATLAIIDRAIGAGLRQALIDRALMLVLPRGSEEVAQRDSSTGELVTSEAEGREIKTEHISSTLAHHGCRHLQLNFMNVRSPEDCEELQKTLIERVQAIRRRTEHQVDDLIGVIGELLGAAQTEEATAVFEAATKDMREWLTNNTALPKLPIELHCKLIEEMERLRWASSLRASVNRRGNRHNFDYWHGLGFGVRSETVARSENRISQLTTLIRSAIEKKEFAPAQGFLGHLLTEIDKSTTDFYQWIQSVGENAFKSELGDDDDYWSRCRDRWGGGSGYRDAIQGWTEEWFSATARTDRATFIEAEIQRKWAEMLTRLRTLLSSGATPTAPAATSV